MKTAVIIGSLGQDGRILTRYLRDRQYSTVGIDIGHIESASGSIKEPVNISNRGEVEDFIRALMPDELYYLAAVHHSAEEILQTGYELFQKSFEINTFSLIYFLDAILKYSPQTRLFYAVSSHIFEEVDGMQDENSRIDPSSIYAISKSSGLFSCRYYRKEYGIFAACGILYNHESSLRSDHFISKKIIKSAIRIRDGLQDKLILGDLSSEVDWGYAPDYVRAMHKILNLNNSDDFIIATGKMHSVAEFAEIAFRYLGLNWTDYVEEDKTILNKKPVCRIGNPEKLMKSTSWKPSVGFEDMIKIMLEEEGAI